MASGSSGRTNNLGSKGFDFGSDDILCSYEDYGNQDGSNGNHSDPVIGANSAKEFHKSRMTRSSVFPSSSYSPPEESLDQDVIAAVEKNMKKYADNLMRFLEGISSRMSQLELYCYNLDKSVGEMRSELARDHGEVDLKLKSLDKHLQEVHRSVQILRDKQELAETQKELAKLQLAHKDSSSVGHEERSSPPACDPKMTDSAPDVHGQQLALALPHQVAPQPLLPTRPVEQQQVSVAPPPPMPAQTVTQSQPYYQPPAQVPNPARTLPSPGQYLTSNTQYQSPQMQDISRVAPQPAQINQTPQIPSLPQYQQQWAQQLTPQVQPTQQTSMQPQIRPSSSAVYPSYLPSQPANPSLPETLPNSMPMQVQFSGVSQPISSRAEAMTYGYGGPGRPVQPQPTPQHLKATFGPQQGDGFPAAGPHPTLTPGNTYMVYDSEGGRPHHLPQQHFPQSGYPPASVPLQNPQPAPNSNLMARPPQFIRNHPYNELIEKLVSMGYRSDHIISVIQRLEENGQPVDFNAVLDRLNGHPSGASQRGWSG